MGSGHVLLTKNSVHVNNYSIYRQEIVRELMGNWCGDVSQRTLDVRADPMRREI